MSTNFPYQVFIATISVIPILRHILTDNNDTQKDDAMVRYIPFDFHHRVPKHLTSSFLSVINTDHNKNSQPHPSDVCYYLDWHQVRKKACLSTDPTYPCIVCRVRSGTQRNPRENETMRSMMLVWILLVEELDEIGSSPTYAGLVGEIMLHRSSPSFPCDPSTT